MAGMGLTLEAAKSNFFDRKKVVDAVGRASATVFAWSGAKVRSTAQRSIRYSATVSRPGGPPHGHRTGSRKRVNKKTGQVRVQAVSPLREFILFSWDVTSKTVVVGPVKLSKALSGVAPMALEYGGPSVVRGPKGATRRVSIRARPFMRPALAAVLPFVPAMFRGMVK